jgi:hypothetical protein
VTATREIKRIENLCKFFIEFNSDLVLLIISFKGRSPLYIHTSNTLAGITTIRSSNSQIVLLNEYNVHSDYHTQAYFAFITANRWFAVRLDAIVSVYSVFVIFGCIFVKDYMGLTSGQVGIVMVYMFQIMDYFQWTVRQTAEVENLVGVFFFLSL